MDVLAMLDMLLAAVALATVSRLVRVRGLVAVDVHIHTYTHTHMH